MLYLVLCLLCRVVYRACCCVLSCCVTCLVSCVSCIVWCGVFHVRCVLLPFLRQQRHVYATTSTAAIREAPREAQQPSRSTAKRKTRCKRRRSHECRRTRPPTTAHQTRQAPLPRCDTTTLPPTGRLRTRRTSSRGRISTLACTRRRQRTGHRASEQPSSTCVGWAHQEHRGGAAGIAP